MDQNELARRMGLHLTGCSSSSDRSRMHLREGGAATQKAVESMVHRPQREPAADRPKTRSRTPDFASRVERSDKGRNLGGGRAGTLSPEAAKFHAERKRASVGGDIRSGAEHTGRQLKKGFEGIGNNVRSSAENTGRKIKSGAEDAGRKIKSGAEDAGRKIKNFFHFAEGGQASHPNHPNFAKMVKKRIIKPMVKNKQQADRQMAAGGGDIFSGAVRGMGASRGRMKGGSESAYHERKKASFGGDIKASAGETNRKMKEGFEGAHRKMKSGAEDAGRKIKSGAEDTGRKIKHGAEDAFNKTKSGAHDAYNKVRSSAEDTGRKMKSGFEDAGRKMKNFFHFAEGGDVDMYSQSKVKPVKQIKRGLIKDVKEVKKAQRTNSGAKSSKSSKSSQNMWE